MPTNRLLALRDCTKGLLSLPPLQHEAPLAHGRGEAPQPSSSGPSRQVQDETPALLSDCTDAKAALQLKATRIKFWLFPSIMLSLFQEPRTI